jgi:hypothetical protein
MVMKLSTFLLGTVFAVAVIAVLLLIFGVSFHRPLPSQGATLYNPAEEVVLRGTVQEVQDFACPVSEGEMGTHLALKANDKIVLIHLAPGRIMRSQSLHFSVGDQIEVVGAEFRFLGKSDIIARQITRGNEIIMFRDSSGKLLLVQ